MQCASYGRNTTNRMTGYFSSLTRTTRSMRRTRQPCYRMSGTSGPVACSLRLTATATGPHWWFGTRETDKATSCIERRDWTRGTPYPWLHMASGYSHSSGSFGAPTPGSLSYSKLMTRGREGSSKIYWSTSGTCRRRERPEATTRSQPRASWLWPQGT